MPTLQPEQVEEQMTVADLIEDDGRWWNHEKLVSLFTKEGVEAILNITLGKGAKDRLGRGACSRNIPKNDWDFIWRANAPHRVQLFGWKACKQAVATTRNLVKRRPNIDNYCCTCGANNEDVHHVLLSCDFVRIVWALTDLP
ncbi:hypothetical protein Salat_2817900 [Sesamum alatum]|uniref:Reverse transcriptase zinc-binding domain-containing protein n=1 Tax=Sesamum alatum TaxID=300844 RepID=A0AAE2C9M0_9LAMI|nr:hypothetical protein Salat_2817900 [Sesamum alatum]